MIDIVLENADLPLTSTDGDAVAVDAGRIVALGRGSDLVKEHSPRRRIDLGGKTLLPGFNDAHVHVWKVGHLLTSLVDLRGATSLAEVREKLVAQAAKFEGWVVARGVNELRLVEGRLPTRADLDAWLPGRPVWVTRVCNHVGVASSTALHLAGVYRSAEPPPGGEVLRDGAGELTGQLTETAMSLVTAHLPAPSDDDLAAMITGGSRRLLSFGVTAMTDPGVDDRVLGVYRSLDESGSLVGRFNVMRLAPEGDAAAQMLGWSPPTLTERLRVDTAKFFLDGGLSGATAALSMAYRHADSRGVLRYERDAYAEAVRLADAAGYRTATHVIGDRAIATALDAYESMPDIAKRARFEHFGLPSEADIVRAARLGIGVATQAIFLTELGQNFFEYLPEDFPITPYPIRSMLDAGLLVALSTDAPVVRDERPLAGVAAAASRLTAEGRLVGASEAIRIREALYATTTAGALLSGDQGRFGTITPGLLADFVVLDRSPLEAPLEEIADIAVAMTIVGGEVVYEP